MAENDTKNPVGRPSIFTQEIAEEVCYRIARGESLRNICKSEHLPDCATVFRWLLSIDEDKKEFCEQYARAREIQADCIFDDIIEIADDGSRDVLRTKKLYDEDSGTEIYVKEIDKEFVQRSKLRIEARQWWLGKVAPKKYGDLSKRGDVNVQINIAERLREGRKRIDPALRVFTHDG